MRSPKKAVLEEAEITELVFLIKNIVYKKLYILMKKLRGSGQVFFKKWVEGVMFEGGGLGGFEMLVAVHFGDRHHVVIEDD